MIGFTLKRLICSSVEMNIEGGRGGGGGGEGLIRKKKLEHADKPINFAEKYPIEKLLTWM